MNVLKVLTYIYGVEKNYFGMPYWVMTPVRRLTRAIANYSLPKYLSKPLIRNGIVEKDLIVSLTSFPARINDVWMVIECLKRQSLLPEKVFLWLSKEQFPSREDVPYNLRVLEDPFFEIRFVDGDIRSHKKYYYALKEFPNKTIITVDDDVFYNPNTIEKLVSTSKRFPQCIISNHTSEIIFDNNGNVVPYQKWNGNVSPFSSSNLLQIGVGGVLYPPNCLHELVTRKDLFLELAPLADDLWLNAMARLKGTPIVQTSDYKIPLPIESKTPSLTSVNNGGNMNDKQIKNIRTYLISNGLLDVYSSKCQIL